jgi:hypothetical protein
MMDMFSYNCIGELGGACSVCYHVYFNRIVCLQYIYWYSRATLDTLRGGETFIGGRLLITDNIISQVEFMVTDLKPPWQVHVL